MTSLWDYICNIKFQWQVELIQCCGGGGGGGGVLLPNPPAYEPELYSGLWVHFPDSSMCVTSDHMDAVLGWWILSHFHPSRARGSDAVLWVTQSCCTG